MYIRWENKSKNGLGRLLEDPFDGITPAKKEEFIDIQQLRSLTDTFIFCPKCGMKNTFELSKTGQELNYFCKRCSSKLNPYWDSHQNGEIAIVNCKSCQQATFKKLKYCISCGLQRKAVAAKRSREISKLTRQFELEDDVEEVASTFCLFGPCDYVLDLIMTRTLKRLPRICTYICAVIALAGLAFIIAIIVMAAKDLWWFNDPINYFFTNIID